MPVLFIPISVGPNVYHVPGCVGKTVESDKHQAPAVTITGRSKVGGFAEDLQKVLLQFNQFEKFCTTIKQCASETYTLCSALM